MTTRICIISGNAERRAAIKAVLAAMPHVITAGEIGEAAALRLLAPLAPDLVLLDAAAPVLNPVVVLQTPLNMPVVVLAATGSLNEQQLFRELGAHAVVPPNQFDHLASILSSIAGQADQNGVAAPRPVQPSRRHWARNVSAMLTRH